MTKEEIGAILGCGEQVKENPNRTAFDVFLLGSEIDVIVTVPYEVHEIFYQAKDKQGVALLEDWSDFYGDTELEDFTGHLLEIAQIMISPEFRIANNGKTVEVHNSGWQYFFGNSAV